jgi:nucleoside-diphosphate-sugar epimerase
MRSDCTDVLNIGSDEMISINGLVGMISDVAKMNVRLKHIPGPLGVRGRNSDNSVIVKKLGWRPSQSLIRGIEKTYPWISRQVKIATGAASNCPAARGLRDNAAEHWRRSHSSVR